MEKIAQESPAIDEQHIPKLAYKSPAIDDQNPLWCPSQTPTRFMNFVRRKNRSNVLIPIKNKGYLKSFLYTLEKALVLDSGNIFEDNIPSKPIFPPAVKRKNRRLRKTQHGSSTTSSEDSLPLSLPTPAWEQDEEDSISPLASGKPWARTTKDPMLDWCLPHGKPASPAKKELYMSSFTDIEGPTAHELSQQMNQESSFDVTLQHETLLFPPPGINSSPYPKSDKTVVKSDPQARIQELEDQLYGPAIGTQSPLGLRYFITQLDSLLPGIRLKERLSDLAELSHDTIGGFLASNGYLNARVLSFLRSSEVRELSMTESLRDVNGLNVCRSDTMAVFGKPNSFHHLSQLSFTDVRITESDFIHISRLPSLSSLLLINTAISNEVVFLLLPLKGTLSQLSIADNPSINDDAVPALLLLSKLSFLSILDTSIGMPGVRRLASTIYAEDRTIDIELPMICEAYIAGIEHKYALELRWPLISRAAECEKLSNAALERNLEAHAAVNKDIIVVGTKAEKMERLRKILEVRALDLLVRDMILGPGDDETL